jgi:hypothetical protein
MKHLRTFESHINSDNIKACVQELVDDYSLVEHDNKDRVAYLYNGSPSRIGEINMVIDHKLLSTLKNCVKKLIALDNTFTIKITVAAALFIDDNMEDVEYDSVNFICNGMDIEEAILSKAEECYGIIYANAFAGDSNASSLRDKVVRYIDEMDIQVMKDK